MTTGSMWSSWATVKDTERLIDEPTDGRPVRSVLNVWCRGSDGLWRSERTPNGHGVPWSAMVKTLDLRYAVGEEDSTTPMTQDLTTLIPWLLDQIDVDKHDARNRAGTWPYPSVKDDGYMWLHIRPGGNAVVVQYPQPVEGYDDMAKLRAWAEPAGSGWHQDRVLTECETKRKIIDDCRNEYEPGGVTSGSQLARRTLIAYGAMYAALGRDGYRPEWTDDDGD